MKPHHPLCPWDTEDFRGNSRRCECELIWRVRVSVVNELIAFLVDPYTKGGSS